MEICVDVCLFALHFNAPLTVTSELKQVPTKVSHGITLSQVSWTPRRKSCFGSCQTFSFSLLLVSFVILYGSFLPVFALTLVPEFRTCFLPCLNSCIGHTV